MPASTNGPFVVIWSPKSSDEQPDLYAALKRLAEPQNIETIKGMAVKYGVPGFEFQLLEIQEHNSDIDGKLMVKLCYDKTNIDPNSEVNRYIQEGIKAILGLDLPLGIDKYEATGANRTYHDTTHIRLHNLTKLHDSRPVVAAAREV